MYNKILRVLARLNIISSAYCNRLIKRRAFLSSIKSARSLIAETDLLCLPFFYEPYRTTIEELLGSSGLHKMYEQDNYRLKLISNTTSPTILDIGSHIGIFPRVIKHRFPSSKIYSLEPDRNNFRVLNLNNSLLENVKSFQLGVHEKSMTLQLAASDFNSWRSSLTVNQDFFRHDRIGNDSYSYDSYDVECVSIDYFVESEGITNLDLIGITVPGEIAMSILRGSLKTLRDLRPVVSIFLYDTEVNTVRDFMRDLNYQLLTPTSPSMYVFSSNL